MEITLNLPENVYRNFTKLAEKRHRPVEDVITAKLRDDFSAENVDYEETVAGWSDKAVLALAKMKIPEETCARMTTLSKRVQEGKISDSEEREFEVYVELGQISTVRKAYGIAEAVKRGLITSLNDLA